MRKIIKGLHQVFSSPEDQKPLVNTSVFVLSQVQLCFLMIIPLSQHLDQNNHISQFVELAATYSCNFDFLNNDGFLYYFAISFIGLQAITYIMQSDKKLFKFLNFIQLNLLVPPLFFTFQTRASTNIIETTIFEFLTLVLVISSSLFSNQFLNTGDPMAMKSPVLTILDTVTKIIGTILLSLSGNQFVNNFWAVFGLLSSGMKLLQLFNDPPYYSMLTMKLSLVFSGIQLSINIGKILVLLRLINELEICVLLFSTIFARLALEFSSTMFLRSLNKKDKKALWLKFIIKNSCNYSDASKALHHSNEKQEFFKMYILSLHRPQCRQLECLCKYSDHEGFQTMPSQSSGHFQKKCTLYNFSLRLEAYQEYLEKDRSNTIMHCNYLNELINSDDHCQKMLAIQTFFKVTTKIGLFEEIYWEKIKCQIKSFIDENSTDLIQYLKYEKERDELVKLMKAQVEKSLLFWDVFSERELKIREILKKSRNSVNFEAKIDSHLKKLSNAYPEFSKADYLLVMIYKFLVTNSVTEFRDLAQVYDNYHNQVEEAQRRFDHIASLTLSDLRNITVNVEMGEGKVGLIRSVSKNIINYLQWNSEDLYGLNIEVLLPNHLQSNNLHQKLLYSHLKTGETQQMGTNNLVYIRNKDNTLTCAYLNFNINPCECEKLIYTAILRPLMQQPSTLLILRSGIIDGYTSNYLSNFGSMNKKISLCDIDQGLTHYLKIINLFEYLESMSINSPTWLVTSHQRSQRQDVANELPYPFSESPDQAKHLCIPQSLKEYHSCKDIYDLLISEGLQANINGYDSHIKVTLIKSPNVETVYAFEFSSSNKNQKKSTIRNETIDQDQESCEVPWESELLAYNAQTTLTLKASSQSVVKTLIKTDFTKDSSDKPKGFKRVGEGGSIFEDSHQVATSSLLRKVKAHSALDVDGLAKLRKAIEGGGKKMRDNRSVRSKSTISSGISYAMYQQQVTNALSAKFMPIFMKILLFAKAIFLVTFLSLLVVYYSNSKSIVTSVSNSVAVLDASSLRYFELADIGRRIWCMINVKNDIIPVHKWPQYPNFGVLCQALMTNSLELAAKYNEEMQEALDQIDSSLKEQFYQPITMTTPGSVISSISVDQFTATDMVLLESHKIYALPWNSFDSNSPENQFVYENILNGILVKSDETYNLITNNTDNQLQSLESFLIACFVFSGVFASLYIFFYARFEISQYWSKVKYFNSFSRLDKSTMKNQIDHLKRLNEILNNENKEPKKHYISIKSDAKAMDKLSKRHSDLSGIGFASIKRFGLTLIIIALCLAIVGAFWALIISFSSDFQAKVQSFVTVRKVFADFPMLFTVMYQYVGANITGTYRNQPIGTEFPIDLQFLVDSQQAIDDLKIMLPSEYLPILEGNLCEIVPLSKNDKIICYYCNGGASTKGIIQVLEYAKDSYIAAQQNFISSNRSTQEMTDILNNLELNNTSAMLTRIVRYPNNLINQALENLITSDINTYTSNLLVVMVVMVVVILSGAIVIGYYIYKNLEEEIFDSKSILKNFSAQLILSHKSLKDYLSLNSSEMIRSISI